MTAVVHAITAATDAGGDDPLRDSDVNATLPEALQLAFKEKPQSFKVCLGKALDKRVDTCFGEENFRLEKTRNTHSKTSQWRVVAGDAGSYSAPTRSDSEELRNQTCEEKSNRIGWDKTTHPTQGDDAQKASSGLQTGARLDSPSLHDTPKNETVPSSPARESQREVEEL